MKRTAETSTGRILTRTPKRRQRRLKVNGTRMRRRKYVSFWVYICLTSEVSASSLKMIQRPKAALRRLSTTTCPAMEYKRSAAAKAAGLFTRVTLRTQRMKARTPAGTAQWNCEIQSSEAQPVRSSSSARQPMPARRAMIHRVMRGCLLRPGGLSLSDPVRGGVLVAGAAWGFTAGGISSGFCDGMRMKF